MENYKFKIAGVKFRGARIYELLKTLENGTVFELEAEPDNSFDPNAIKLLYDDGTEEHFVGYVPKTLSSEVSAALEIEPWVAVATDFSPDKKSYEFEVQLKAIADFPVESDEELDQLEVDEDYDDLEEV